MNANIYETKYNMWNTQRVNLLEVLRKIKSKDIGNGQKFCCSVTQSWLNLCDLMHCSTPGFSVLYHLPEFVQTHVHWVGDTIQPSRTMLSPSPPAFNLSQHQGLFTRVNNSHLVLEFQLQHQSSNEYSGLISSRVDLLYLLTV